MCAYIVGSYSVKASPWCVLQSATKSNSMTSEIPLTSMFFHVCEKTYSAASDQRILAHLVPFES